MENRRKPFKKNQKLREEDDYFKSSLTQVLEEGQNSSDHRNINKNNMAKQKSHQTYFKDDNYYGYGINSKNKNNLDESENFNNNANYYEGNYYQNYPAYQGNQIHFNYDYQNKFSNYGNVYNQRENYHNNYDYNYSQNTHQVMSTKHKKYNKASNYNQYESSVNHQKQRINKLLNNLNTEIPEMTINQINGLIEYSIDCMICGEVISSSTEIWQCNTCYTLLHNKCIYDWIFKLNSSKTGSKEIFKWTCPHCSQNYQASSDDLPTYNCFCEKFYTAQSSGHKEFNPNLIPHGCGLKCDREICKHVKCNLPCHPGPHIACNVVDMIKCFCGRSEKEILCTNPNKKFSCNEKCNNHLKCNRHRCRVICHEGECEQYFKNRKCEECVDESRVKFYKFLKEMQLKMNNESKLNLNSFADCMSDFIFNGTLFCARHQEEVNTDNNLQLFLRLIKISGNKLIDNIKKFIPICNKVVENSCDCKNKIANVECYKLNYPKDIIKFLGLSFEKELEKCTKVCKTFKSCKIHRCNRVCCELANKIIRNYSVEDPLGYHLCLLPCEKLLSCKKHKCENYCHKGTCKPCATIIREGYITCDCGKTKIQAPYQCGLTVDCKFQCDKMKKCEHKCKLTCHSGECLPCDEITFKVCNCKKNVIQNLKCGDPTIPTCSTPCQEMLPCGAHFCQINCHDHTEEYDIKYFCTLPCSRDFTKCKHKCSKRCHGEEDCNEIDCDSLIKIFCGCKVNSKSIKCGEYKKIIDNNSSYVLSCNEECKKKDRLKKIEQAFDGLLKFSDEKFKSMYKKSENNIKEGDEISNSISVKYSEIKFDHNTIEFVKSRVKFFIDLEILIDKAVINLEKKYEIHDLDKKLYMFCSELLKNYYNIKSKKVKNINDALCSLVLTDCSEALLPRNRLTLLALLFKNRKFVEDKKINHPFAMSIFIQNYRFSVTIENLENHLLYLTKSISKNDFYIDQITPGKCYVHFFNMELGQKIFNCLKNSPSQFQDCFEHIYESKEKKFEDLYMYMKNTEYFNLLNYKDEFEKDNSPSESTSTANPKSSDEEMDNDGFVKVKKNKKPK